MPKHVTASFDRDFLVKLFRHLGSDNEHERAVVIAKINDLLARYRKTWADVPGLLARGSVIAVNADLARHVSALGSHDTSERESARQWILDLLIRCRRTWNDLADLLLSPASPSWADSPADSTPPPGFDDADFAVIDLVRRVIEWSIWLKPEQCIAAALWILHAHVYVRFEVTPRLALVSPVRGCGKTELVRLIETLVPKPERSDSITPAAIYHIIDERHPTMLLDEGDNIGLLLPVNGIYRAVLNSGHRRGGCRTILHRGRVRRFSTHAPLLVAGIGSFPLPLMHRAVVIEMERHDGSSELKRFTGRDEVIDYIYGRLRSWAHDVELNEDPELPPQLRNRGADNWRPLIAIADSFGPEWGRLARNAAIAFARGQQAEDAGVILLYDIRSVFDQLNVDRIAGSELIAEVIAMNDYWNDWRDDRLGRKLTLGDLTRLLRQFHIQSKSIWPVPRTPSSRSRKGYTRDQFEAAWRSYCSDGTAAQSKKTMRLIGS